MATTQEKVQCVSWYIETKSDVETQRNYRTKYGKDPPSCPSIRAWHRKFIETGSVSDKERDQRSTTSDEHIDRERQSFDHSPRNTMQLELPDSTVHKVLQNFDHHHCIRI